MILFRSVRGLALALATAATLAAAEPSHAEDDITDAHLKAAREAVAAIHATDMYDSILPQAADALKHELIQKNPDLTDSIVATVDAKALEIASRRADLEKEAALAYARSMSEADLKAIADFYRTPAGLALLDKGPIVTREVGKAAQIWQAGIARDLAEEVGKVISAEVAKENPQAQQGDQQPAAQDEGQKPADGDAKPAE
ncbi:MAG: DUF2059 domain-containing protein [Rhizobiales bacterium]|nr:DUF2059 domain-containing protein [Hyphomicrobiales bacterium]